MTTSAIKSILTAPANLGDTGRSENGQSNYKWLRVCCWSVALALGAAQAWATRFTMNPDGVSYLDIGDAYWRADWHNAINAYWSPLYSWVLGFFLKVFKPSAHWEYPLVHLVNFLMYTVALVCFDLFLSTFIEQTTKRDRDLIAPSEMGLPKWVWLVVGYSLFVSSSLLLITNSFLSADMTVAAIVYLASALILNIRKGVASRGTFVWLGLIIGLGYLTKTVMFLMSVPFLAVAAAAQKHSGRSIKPVALSALAFFVVACPFVLLLSLARGRPTFGDSGKINYEINVNEVDFFIPEVQTAQHPIRKIAGLREAYEYAYPISGTYPPWYDPSYWHEGIEPHFDARNEMRSFGRSILQCCWISLSAFSQLNITATLLFLYFTAPGISGRFKSARSNWLLWLPALSGISLYSIVVIEARYVGALFCLLWLVGFSGVRMPISAASRRLAAVAALGLALTTCLVIGRQISQALNGFDLAGRHVGTPTYWKVAGALNARGIKPGEKLAVIAEWPNASQGPAYVARLARVEIIGEMRRPDDFWAADASTRSRLIASFAGSGAKAILICKRPQIESGWERLADSDYYLYRLGIGMQ